MMSLEMISDPASESELAEMDRFLLDEDDRIRPLPADYVRGKFRHSALRCWLQARGRYLLPTVELVIWLRGTLGGQAGFPEFSSALEIGAGCGDLGYRVGLRMTDSYMQQLSAMRLLYGLIGQKVTEPPSDVERLDGVTAVRKYKPHTVVAAWVTQLWRHGDTERGVGACSHGVDEQQLLTLCRRYVFIGNEGTHKDKRILAEPHNTTRPSWLISRAKDPSKDVIWTWERA